MHVCQIIFDVVLLVTSGGNLFLFLSMIYVYQVILINSDRPCWACWASKITPLFGKRPNFYATFPNIQSNFIFKQYYKFVQKDMKLQMIGSLRKTE